MPYDRATRAGFCDPPQYCFLNSASDWLSHSPYPDCKDGNLGEFRAIERRQSLFFP